MENNCETEGIFSPVAGIIGSLQANEVLKTVLNLKSDLATTKTYTIKDMCGSPANETKNFISPGNILYVPLKNLINGQVYYYSFGSDDSNTGFSPVYSFHFGPKSNETTTFIGYGDMGAASIGKNSTKVILENIDDNFIC